MERELYLITCDNELAWRDTEKYLSEAEAKVIEDIFKDLSSPYFKFKIEKMPIKETIKNLYDTGSDIAAEFHIKYKDEF